MNICIACGDEIRVVKQINAIEVGTENRYKIEFCKCGIGKSIVDNINNSTINSEVYNDLENRIKIYYNRLFNHLNIRNNEAFNRILESCEKKDALIIGSNIGVTANYAKSKGLNVKTCEINDKCRAFSKLVYDIDGYKDFFDVKVKFDILTMFDVLEHFPNPEAAIKKSYEVLNESGIIFIQLPNNNSSAAKLYGENWNWYNPPDHTYHFCPNSLKLLVERNGFNVAWNRTVDVIEDKKLAKCVPRKFRSKFIELLYKNPYYHPKLYPNKKGSGGLIQMIVKKK